MATASQTGASGRAPLDAAADPPGLSPNDPLPLRVGFADPGARGLLGQAVEAVDVSETHPDLDGLDAVVATGPSGEVNGGGHERLADAAKRAGIPLIRTDSFAPAVDVTRFNPMGFSRDEVAGYWAVASATATPAGLERALPTLAAVAAHEPVTLRGPAWVLDVELPKGVGPGLQLEPDREDFLEIVQKRLAVVDHPGFHRSDWHRAGWIATLCACGMPVVAADVSDELAALLGEELAEMIEAIDAPQLADLDERERISMGLRRLALRDHSVTGRWRQIAAEHGLRVPERPLVSVIFSTRRDKWLEFGLAQVARQSYEPRELVVCLHGSDFPGGTADRIRDLTGGTAIVLETDGDLTLGESLNAGVAASSGALITKMDDDDYYSVDHLWDLALAVEYSRADLVGKAAEFVYLEEIDLTVRQISESVDTRLAGGGMMARRRPLVEQGGWPKRTRGEDLALIRMYDGNGRTIHRIPPHGYILNRHGRDHTWRPAVDYFLFRSERQWRGLRYDTTAIEPLSAAERAAYPTG